MHVEKFPKQAAPNIFDHCGRSESTRKCDRSNQEIHPERSHLNYNLAAAVQPKNPIEFLNERTSEIYVHGNASVAFASWTIMAPKTLKSEEEAEFFKHAYDRFVQIYGEENVISAFVHYDETTPHMHFCFIPVTEGKHGEKLCAKIVIDRKSLNKMHPDMEKYVSEKLGHHVEILTGATKEGNLAMKDYKRKKALEDIKKAEEKAAEIIQKAEEYKEEVESVNAEINAKKAFLKELENSDIAFDFRNVKEHIPTHSDPEHYYKVPIDVMQNQIKKEAYNNALIGSFDQMVAEKEAFTKLEKENIALKKENKELKEELAHQNKIIERFKKVLEKISEKVPNLKELFDAAKKAVKKEEAIEERKAAIYQDVPDKDDKAVNNDELEH